MTIACSGSLDSSRGQRVVEDRTPHRRDHRWTRGPGRWRLDWSGCRPHQGELHDGQPDVARHRTALSGCRTAPALLDPATALRRRTEERSLGGMCSLAAHQPGSAAVRDSRRPLPRHGQLSASSLGPTVLRQVGRSTSLYAPGGNSVSASRSRFRFRRSKVVGSVSTAERAWRSSALPPSYETVDHLESVDADLPS
jgi:hypothetical protein